MNRVEITVAPTASVQVPSVSISGGNRALILLGKARIAKSCV